MLLGQVWLRSDLLPENHFQEELTQGSFLVDLCSNSKPVENGKFEKLKNTTIINKGCAIFEHADPKLSAELITKMVANSQKCLTLRIVILSTCLTVVEQLHEQHALKSSIHGMGDTKMSSGSQTHAKCKEIEGFNVASFLCNGMLFLCCLECVHPKLGNLVLSNC